MPLPVVALSSSSSSPTGGKPPFVRVNDAYVRAVQGAGLLPVVVPPSLSAADERTLIDSVAGIVLTGGEDVEPARYGATRFATTETSHAGRDATEIALVHAARDAQRPVLAICRGLQLLNVALGGTLVQDLATERPSAISHPRSDLRSTRVHGLSISAGSRLAAAADSLVFDVNSLHHQAIDALAPGLRASAHAPDGVIEAAETTDAWWVLGVQWHPEELVDDPQPWDRAIFAAFAAQCRGPA